MCKQLGGKLHQHAGADECCGQETPRFLPATSTGQRRHPAFNHNSPKADPF